MPSVKTAGLVALVGALAAAGAGCGRISAGLEPAGGKGGTGGGGGGSTDGGADAGSCRGLTEAACSTRQDCVLEPGCPICPWDQPPRMCAPRGELEICPGIACVDPCLGLAEEACAAQPQCVAATCPTCAGSAFAGCVHVGSPPPQCPAPTPCPPPPPPCNGLTEAACAMAQGCTPMYCPSCQGQLYIGCGTGTGGHSCPAVECPIPCSSETTEAACNARGGCHSVFVDPGICDCAPAGCCTHFSRCADGPANCNSGALACKIAAPDCEGPYVISYSELCYEGCVRATECAPTMTTGPR
jgi:hypothetical protein